MRLHVLLLSLPLVCGAEDSPLDVALLQQASQVQWGGFNFGHQKLQQSQHQAQLQEEVTQPMAISGPGMQDLVGNPKDDVNEAITSLPSVVDAMNSFAPPGTRVNDMPKVFGAVKSAMGKQEADKLDLLVRLKVKEEAMRIQKADEKALTKQLDEERLVAMKEKEEELLELRAKNEDEKRAAMQLAKEAKAQKKELNEQQMAQRAEAYLERERKKNEELQRVAKETAERKAKEEADRVARAQAIANSELTWQKAQARILGAVDQYNKEVRRKAEEKDTAGMAERVLNSLKGNPKFKIGAA